MRPLFVGSQGGAGDKLLVTHVTGIFPNVFVSVKMGFEPVSEQCGELTVRAAKLFTCVFFGFHFVDHE